AGGGGVEDSAGKDDGARRDDFPDLARAGDCGAVVQPRGHHPPRAPGGAGIAGRAARGSCRQRGRNEDTGADFPFDRGAKRRGTGAAGGTHVADVARIPGVLAQLRLIAGLRWSLLKNGMQRKNNRWDLVGVIFAGVFGAALVVGLSIAFFAGAYAFLAKNRASWIGLLFWAIFLWWQVFPIFVAGFGANFEFKTLLRFPLSRRTFYLLGLGYGFADFAAVAAVCWVAAMVLGAAVARPEVLPVMAGVSLLFVLMNVTLERLIGSWLEKILAKR